MAEGTNSSNTGRWLDMSNPYVWFVTRLVADYWLQGGSISCLSTSRNETHNDFQHLCWYITPYCVGHQPKAISATICLDFLWFPSCFSITMEFQWPFESAEYGLGGREPSPVLISHMPLLWQYSLHLSTIEPSSHSRDEFWCRRSLVGSARRSCKRIYAKITNITQKSMYRDIS